jgi:CheY-like chemotaxis protein
MDRPRSLALIDDDSNWIESLTDYLAPKGYAIKSAADGPSGLKLLEQHTIPVALVDFHMPGMNGLELLRELHRRGRQVAVLLVSADEEPTLAERARQEGAFAFYPKTTAPGVLLQGVSAAFRSLHMPDGETGKNGNN